MKISRHRIFRAIFFIQTILLLGGCIVDLDKHYLMPPYQLDGDAAPDSETFQDCEETCQDAVSGEPIAVIDLETASDEADAEVWDAEGETGPLPACGNGISDASEECDDGNSTDGDGCESDCKFSCHEDPECNDGNGCTDDGCERISSGKKCYNINNSSECDDSDPCTSQDRCFDGVCHSGSPIPVWYRDTDGDGFGNESDVLCAQSRPDSYVADSSDCCDTDPRVNPAQAGFFTENNHCGDFDYNCDCNIEMQTPNVLNCDFECIHEWEIGPCPEEPVPSCGEEFILWLCFRHPFNSICFALPSNLDPPASDFQRCR